jgi:hypothetical protein
MMLKLHPAPYGPRRCIYTARLKLSAATTTPRGMMARPESRAAASHDHQCRRGLGGSALREHRPIMVLWIS